MADLVRTYTITIGKVYNGEEECTSPHVELAGKQHIAVNCIDLEGCKYQVQLGPNDTEPCLTFFVTCEDCDVCGTKVIKKCFCDSIDDCDDCEVCDDEGFCTSICTHICENGTCIECNDETPCTCNQDCQNGDCTCPTGSTLNANGCCDACTKDADCDTCEVCVVQGGYNACVAKDCNCDSSGKCGTAGECVECTNSGHCPAHEVCDSRCECQCAPGYRRINGICTPTECPNGDDDCETCEICSGEVCIPLQCPAGKVPAEVDGVCNCVQECNCAHPDCSSKFNYCGESSIPGKCACLPCEGDCDAGCEDPCICDEDLNKCKFNPCFGTCDSGLDCGPTCGCDNGTCVPCDSLSCADDDCSRALGCECTAAQKCAKDSGCNDAPCSVASDCGTGCTCDEGTCQSCSNYSCVTGDCSDRDGCACTAGNCGEDDGECGDTATLEKDDDACELTATLIKDNCCQCPALTLDAKVKSVADVSGQKRVTYTAEVRKGSYDGVSVDSNPLVDDFDHDNIAENEPPISGTIKLSYVINYTVYDVTTGSYIGMSSADPVVVKKAYNPTDGISQKEFIIDFPKIGTETTSGQTKSIVSSIEVTFSLDTSMSFENDCVYPSGTEIGVFKITTNDTFLATPIGSTITAPTCRKPLFKWTKFKDGSTTGDTFRKIYIDPVGVGAYVDTISGPTDAQSCYTYVFEPDCNCDDPVTKHVVFCNPSTFDKPVLTNCGKTYNFIIPATCSANSTKYYELLINGTAVTINSGKSFLLTSDAIASGTFSAPITSIVLHMICDTASECDIEFEYDEKNVSPTPIGTCQADGTVDFSFPTLSTSIISVTFDGVTKTSGFTFEDKQPNTEYTYVVVYSDGCISDEETTSKDDCCNDPEITCLSTGKYQVTSTSGFTGMTYNNLPIPSSGIITPPTTGSYSLIYTCGGVSKSITVLPYSQNNDCCKIIPPTISHAGTSITVGIDAASTGGPFTVVLGSQSKTIIAGGSDTFTAVPTGVVTLTITSTVNTACVYTEVINVSDCNLGLELTLDSTNCQLVASTDDQPCDCPNGKVEIGISSIASYPGNKISFGYNIAPTIDDSTGIGVLSSTIKIYENNGVDAVSTKSITSLAAYPNSAQVNVTTSTSTINIPFEGNILPCSGCDGGHPETYALHIYIAAPYSLLSANGTLAEPLGGGHYAVYFSPTSPSSVVSLKFTDGTTDYTTLKSFTDTINDPKQFLTISTTAYGTCTNIKLVYEVSLADGCAYKGELSKTICIGQTYPSTTIGLTKTDAVREMEFILYEDAVQIRRDFEEDFEMIYTTTEVDFQPGSEYGVKAICGCEEEESTTECFDSTITLIDVDSCNRHFEIDIASCYVGQQGTIYLGSASTGFTIDSDEPTHVIFDLPTPLTTEDIVVTIEYEGGVCSQTETIGSTEQPVFETAYTCTNPGVDPDYDVEITATIGGDSVPVEILSIPAGTGGTIVDNTITGITIETSFYADVKLNGIAGCTGMVQIQSDCDCNITGASITSSVNACMINDEGSITVQLSTTRGDTGLAWKAVTSSGITLVSSSTSASNVNATISDANLTTLAPSVGSNTVTVYFKDVASGTTCKTKTFVINKTVLDYDINANDCSGAFWSIDIDNLTSGATIGSLSSGSGSISGSSIINIPGTKTPVSFTISKGTCSESESVSGGCNTCSSNNIDITSSSLHPADGPCTASGAVGLVDTYVTSNDGNCPIASVVVDGVYNSVYNTTYNRWRATLPSTASGTKNVVVTDACGCTAETTVQVNQNCCAAAQGVTISVSDPGSLSPPYADIIVGETITAQVMGLPSGYTAQWGTAEVTGGSGSVSVTQGGTTTLRTLTLSSIGGSPTSFRVPVQIKSGSTTCTTLYVVVVIADSPVVDVCAGYTGCTACQSCYDNGGSPGCQGDLSTNGDACTGGECCNGSCTPTADLCVADELCDTGCGYTSCNGCVTVVCNNCYDGNISIDYTECTGEGIVCTTYSIATLIRNSTVCVGFTTSSSDYSVNLYANNGESVTGSATITAVDGTASQTEITFNYILPTVNTRIEVEYEGCVIATSYHSPA